jgi:hypothetical protein
MSMTNPTTTTGSTVRGDTSDSFGSGRGSWLETKPFAATSEFWLTIVGIAAVLIAGYVVDDPAFNLFRAWLLATVLASAYIVSRGIAKAGSAHAADRR